MFFWLFLILTLSLTSAKQRGRNKLLSQQKCANPSTFAAHNYFNSMPKESTVGQELWIDHPRALENIMALELVPQWIKDESKNFIRDGYIVLKAGLNSTQCNNARNAFHNYCKSVGEKCEGLKNEHGHLPRLMNAHTVVPAVRDLILANKRALMMQDFLFGAKTSIYTSLLFSRGTEQPIHVDIPFFWTNPKNRYFGLWTAIEDVDENNGPLRVLVGGHKCNLLDEREKIPKIVNKKKVKPIANIDSEAFYAYANATLANCAAQNITEYRNVHLQAGDVIIWHPLLPHGGSPIKDKSRTRYSLVAHTVPEMVPVFKTDVFFDSSKQIPNTAQWPYQVVKAAGDVPDYRLMADGDHFAFSVGEGY